MICSPRRLPRANAISRAMNMNTLRLLLAGAIISVLLTACSDSEPVFHEEDRPLRLSAWNLFSLSENEFSPSDSSLVFRPANQLFTDYALKLRTLWIPAGTQAKIVDDEIQYPIGTILSKTFYYPSDVDGQLIKQTGSDAGQIDLQFNQLIETRLLVNKATGWDAFPYVWNDEQTEAFLRVAGASKPISLGGVVGNDSEGDNLDFVYFVPNENQCSGCHTTSHPDGGMHPLGAVLSQLSSKVYNSEGVLQLQTELMQARGWLDDIPSGFETSSWSDTSLGIDERAMAYLNIHCGHCHNPEGAADTSALILDGSHELAVNMGVCKPPVAAGGGAGDLLYSIVPGAPDRSILLFRMNSQAPDEMMPELGRSLIHHEGVELISRWIEELAGGCG